MPAEVRIEQLFKCPGRVRDIALIDDGENLAKGLLVLLRLRPRSISECSGVGVARLAPTGLFRGRSVARQKDRDAPDDEESEDDGPAQQDEHDGHAPAQYLADSRVGVHALLRQPHGFESFGILSPATEVLAR